MYFHYHHILNNTDSSGSGFWGAFLGAFFAFIFGLITYVITKRRERFVQHKNALIKLDRAMNKHLNDLGVTEVLVKDSNKILGEGKVSTNRLYHLKMPENLTMDLGSIDLINKVFTYELSIDRLNFNIDSVNHALTRLEDMFISGQQPQPENFNFIRRLLDGFNKDLPRLNKRTIKLLVLSRINQKKLKNKNFFIYGVIKSSWEQEISKAEIDEERKKLADEMQKILKDDGEGF